MIEKITETILVYQQRDLDAWKHGDKSVIRSFGEIPSAVANQPDYHFGEMFTLARYHETYGWKGFDFYALGPQYPNSESRRPGRAVIEQVIPAGDLKRFRHAQAADPLISKGGGEPDLFLYNDSGAFMFVEVKMKSDRLGAKQIRCIALVRAVLHCPVDIVYLREERQVYQAKTHSLDLAPFL